MNLTVTILDGQADIFRGDIKIASIGLDPWEQVDKILLMPDISEDEATHVIRLAGSHIRNYVRNREITVLGGLMRAERRNNSLTKAMSHEILEFQQIDDNTQTMTVEEIKEICKALYIPIIIAQFRTIDEAIAAILTDPRLSGKISYETTELNFLGEMGLIVHTDEKSGFRFWHSVRVGSGGFDLHVVPLYHPVRQTGRTSVGMVNGDTDAYIRGRSVRSIYAPEQARKSGGSWATWGCINHPYRATGPSFGMKIVPWELLSHEGSESLKDVLLAALEVDGKYVEISGGFRAPAGTPTISHSDKRFGSEEKVYWSIQVLKEEVRSKEHTFRAGHYQSPVVDLLRPHLYPTRDEDGGVFIYDQIMTPRTDRYIPWDKSWIIRLGLLDLIHGRSQISDFLRNEHANLSDDLLALERAIGSWQNGQPIDVGESGTLYRFLQFTAWKQGSKKVFITRGTLHDRPITVDPSIIHQPQETLLNLDNQTSQWASAAALNGDLERISHPPFKLALTYLAIDHWRSQITNGGDWIPRQDDTIRAQAEAYIDLLAGKPLHFTPHQAEDYCFARAFGVMTADEGLRHWPALIGHESNRIKEMETQLARAATNRIITSRDHRVVQAIAMCGASKKIALRFECPLCVRKSWPLFWDFLEATT